MFERPNSQSLAEAVARVVHAMLGLLCAGVAGWFALFVVPFNWYGFVGFAVVGSTAFYLALFGPRRFVLWGLPWLLV